MKELITEHNLSKIDGYAEAMFFSFSQAEYMKRLYNDSPVEKSIIRPFSEKYYRDVLAKKLNAKVEVKTPVGAIDVLSDNEIIEVKTLKNWKGALGQVLAYSYFYPKHKKSIHLYGPDNACIAHAIHVCKSYDVDVTYVTRQEGVENQPQKLEPLSRIELVHFRAIVNTQLQSTKSEGAKTFYSNLVARIEDEILNTFSLEELEDHNQSIQELAENTFPSDILDDYNKGMEKLAELIKQEYELRLTNQALQQELDEKERYLSQKADSL